jgi:hypothetical protein
MNVAAEVPILVGHVVKILTLLLACLRASVIASNYLLYYSYKSRELLP